MTTSAIEANPTLWRVISHGATQTRRLGAELGKLLEPGMVVLLCGPFGAGKTVFVQGIAEGLGVQGPVSSPSFVFVHEHSGSRNDQPFVLYHIDLYRIEGLSAAADLGLEEYFTSEGICVVEWGERALSLAPQQRLLIQFEFASDRTRRLTWEAEGPEYLRLVDSLRQALS
ncbi:MAG: tRNA (adenosine(37)-N6)-threonylcarbamoyltransferase complex ATPase subunit type 1 TsaE [Chloroflexi bacterium]|nr:tRNA (adenosine(37)-N6)-threonylcarbamoyltransferase complex ATPase subunit type 1 TsaE [Chloroflexota bacterium]